MSAIPETDSLADDTIEADDETIGADLEPDDEPVETFRRRPGRPARATLMDPRLRQLPERRPATPSAPSWWTGLTRNEFSHLSDYEAERMRMANVRVPNAHRVISQL